MLNNFLANSKSASENAQLKIGWRTQNRNSNRLKIELIELKIETQNRLRHIQKLKNSLLSWKIIVFYPCLEVVILKYASLPQD